MATTRYVNKSSATGGDGTTSATTGANRAYNSLFDAEAAIPSLSDDWIISCAGTTKDTTPVSFAGTTLNGHTITVECTNGEYVLEANASSIEALTIAESSVTVRGFRVANIHASAYAAVAIETSGITGILLDKMILYDGTLGLYLGGGSVTMRNCIVYGAATEGVYIETDPQAPTLVMHNCTVGANAEHGIRRVAGTLNCTNCYAGGRVTGNDYQGTITKTTCASSDATGSTGLRSIAHSTANFVNVTAGSQNYHVKSDSATCFASGQTNMSGTYTTDIDGETRTAWGVGADFYVAPPATGNPWYAYQQI